MTKHDFALFHEFLVLKDETKGQIDSSRAEQVSQRVPYNGSRNTRYEPNSLRAFFASFERHLKEKTTDFAL